MEVRQGRRTAAAVTVPRVGSPTGGGPTGPQNGRGSGSSQSGVPNRWRSDGAAERPWQWQFPEWGPQPEKRQYPAGGADEGSQATVATHKQTSAQGGIEAAAATPRLRGLDKSQIDSITGGGEKQPDQGVAATTGMAVKAAGTAPGSCRILHGGGVDNSPQRSTTQQRPPPSRTSSRDAAWRRRRRWSTASERGRRSAAKNNKPPRNRNGESRGSRNGSGISEGLTSLRERAPASRPSGKREGLPASWTQRQQPSAPPTTTPTSGRQAEDGPRSTKMVVGEGGTLIPVREAEERR
ncbi:hypothetical protein JRQ81_006681 [Phrynocephalus forsythii]|uniref:Uncharacterized protein n=1 Tax=Phrynocephalus forsythii TaxID=171643 RepID=A0A9Q1B6I3_9SAUR|nr:hypothetical protein JRQ81_006681 [Phrynocephalus forsythii]